MTEQTLQDEFDAWLKAEEVSLSTIQLDAAHALLDVAQHKPFFYAARGAGVTFTLNKLEEFLKAQGRRQRG